MGFTTALGIAAGILFGMIPALQVAAGRKMEAIKEGGRLGTATRSQLRFRSALVTLEIALALVLLVGSGLFLRSLFNLQQVDTGFDAHGVMTGMVALPPALSQPGKACGLSSSTARTFSKASESFPANRRRLGTICGGYAPRDRSKR